MSTLTLDARWRTAMLSVRPTHSTSAFDEAVEAVEAVEAEEAEHRRSKELEHRRGASPKRSWELILFSPRASFFYFFYFFYFFIFFT